MSKFTRREPRWLAEPGNDYDLREYEGGIPTGRVALVRALDEHVMEVPGKHVVLMIDRRRVTIVGRTEPDRTLLRIPWRSFVDACLFDEAGTARVRLDLAVRIGVTVSQLSLWFDSARRAELDRLVSDIRSVVGVPRSDSQAPQEAVPAESTAEVPLLEVHCAPPNNDWLVFLPGDGSAEVLRRTALDRPAVGAVE